jgi:hypothetical protein
MAVEKVGGGRSHWAASQVARPIGHHLVSYRLGEVGRAPPCPYKYPPTGERRHTPHFGDSTSKALFYSVVARCHLVRRVARL